MILNPIVSALGGGGATIETGSYTGTVPNQNKQPGTVVFKLSKKPIYFACYAENPTNPIYFLHFYTFGTFICVVEGTANTAETDGRTYVDSAITVVWDEDSKTLTFSTATEGAIINSVVRNYYWFAILPNE